MKLKGLNFDTTEMMEAESWAALSTLTEHDFQDAFKIGRSAGNGAYQRKGTALKVMVASTLEVSFWQDGITSSGNYEWIFYVSLLFLIAVIMPVKITDHYEDPQRNSVYRDISFTD
jgi:hypothetical protein